MKVKWDKLNSRWLNPASVISIVLAGGTLVLWLATFTVDPQRQQLSLATNFHISVCEGFSGNPFGCLAFFNGSKTGPYRGSIVAMSDTDSPEPDRQIWHWGNYGWGKIIYIDRQRQPTLKALYCDLPGIYFRYFWLANQPAPIWTLMISLWCPLFLFSISPVIWVLRRWFSRGK